MEKANAQRIGVLRRQLLEVECHREIIPAVLPVGVGFIFGPSTAGKTGIAVRTSVAVAAGLQWGGLQVKKGAVLYVTGEARRSVIQRLCATIEYLGLVADHVPIAVMACPKKGLVDGETRLVIRTAAAELVRATGMQMSLIIFDTLSTCFGDAKEDDAAAASKAVTNMACLHEEFDCAVMGVHHPGKKGNREMRGSGVFFNNVDFVLSVDRKGATSILRVEKFKDGPAGARFAFDIASSNLIVADGEISVQVVHQINSWTNAENATVEEATEKQTFTDVAVALNLLRGIVVAGTASLRAWQNACYAHWCNKRTDPARRKAFSTAKKKLQEAGDVTIDGDIVSVSVSKNGAHNAAHTSEPTL